MCVRVRACVAFFCCFVAAASAIGGGSLLCKTQARIFDTGMLHRLGTSWPAPPPLCRTIGVSSRVHDRSKKACFAADGFDLQAASCSLRPWAKLSAPSFIDTALAVSQGAYDQAAKDVRNKSNESMLHIQRCGQRFNELTAKWNEPPVWLMAVAIPRRHLRASSNGFGCSGQCGKAQWGHPKTGSHGGAQRSLRPVSPRTAL